MNFSGYHQHQEQHQQNANDPSQIQAYDQSSQSYYPYTQQYDHQYPTYNPSQQPHHQEPTSVHPPGVPMPPEPGHSAGPAQTQMQNQHLNPVSGAAVNQAAMAVVAGALAQLTHYAAAGNVDEVQRIGPFQYRGRGGRGGRPFRRGGRGQFNPHGPAPYRGRGRGLAGGRHFPSHSSGPTISNVAYEPGASGATSSHSSEPTISNVACEPAAAGATSVVQPSSLVSGGKIPLPNPSQVQAAPFQPSSRKVWCEICKVECNTPEILEQHKNGKRHKKNSLVHEELQRLKSINEQQSGEVPTSQLNLTIQPERIQESEKKGCPAENVGSEATADNHKDKNKLQNNVGETSEVPAEEPEWKPRDNFAVPGRGFKRKMRGGRGGKYTRINDGSRKPVEPPKPKQAISFICELCNVKCESQVVYDSHLTGKRHLSSLKRVHGHQALYGEAGLQTLNSPDISAVSNSINFQGQQGVCDPQVLLAQLLMTVLSQAQVPATASPSGPLPAQIQAPISVAGSRYESLSQNLSQPQVSESATHVVSENPTGNTKIKLSSVPPALDATPGNTQTANGSSETEEKVLKLPQDSSDMTPAENPVAANNQVPTECEAPTS